MKATSYFFKERTLIFLIFSPISVFAQEKENNIISFKLPIFVNTAEVTNLYGPQRRIKGYGIEYRLSAGIEQNFYRGLFLQTGLGYFKNKFFLRRPFDYDTPYTPLFTTESYSYQGIQIEFGLGYRFKFNKVYSFKTETNYNLLYTLKQTYSPKGEPRQVNKSSYLFGRSIISSVGIHRKVFRNYMIGIDLLIPIQTVWKKDKIFRENDTETYRPKLNMGTQFSLSHNF